MDAEQRSPARGQLLRLLPVIYQEQPAVVLFVDALESMLIDERPDSGSLAALISALPALMRPAETREEFLPWLARWIGLELPPDVPLDVQRALVQHAVPLYQRRGTPGALQQLLDIVTGARATVIEPETAGFRIGAAIVGQTQIGRDRPHYFEVVIHAARGESTKSLERLARAFIDLSKPAHTQYTIAFRDRDGRE